MFRRLHIGPPLTPAPPLQSGVCGVIPQAAPVPTASWGLSLDFL